MGAVGPVSGQSEDKRVVRTVLNRSEYLYAGPAFAPFLRSRRGRCRGRGPGRARRLPRVSTFRLRQRYLLV